ncbi:anion permease [archaeon 13_2_20CM_2_52_21]|nr:MAG: anion permease [archaeon 13_2_20CM_2_52_21]OLD08769.1 MAG: anion permease [Crenarchaeota archaeon 13_1_40CM_3_52_4]
MATVIVPIGIVILVILVALVFDFLNGFHDAANSVATVVSTRVLSPRIAVLWAAFFNFVAAFVFGVNVASTIGKGTIDPSIVTAWLLLSTLIGAIVWDIITWWFGLPTSSSHALVGGLIGAGVVKGGWGVIQVSGVSRIILFIALSPLIGLLLAIGLVLLTGRIGSRFPRSTANHSFRRLQLVSAALYSLGHGTNDAQKTMGIIAALLFAQGLLGTVFSVPFYVILMAGTAMGLGTYFGGWRIVRTMGMKITKLQPFGGFSAETAAATTLFATASLGIPVSTTHTIAGAIMGVGSTRRLSAVRWGVARRIVYAWVLTIPAAASIAGMMYYFLSSMGLR